MKLKMFSVYDSKAEAYMQPFYSQTTGLALRSFEAACNKEDHDFYKYGADYTLFLLGEFDQNTAKFDLAPTPVSLGIALTFITQPQQPMAIVGGE